jgi:predicted RNA-binding protein with PIN domain
VPYLIDGHNLIGQIADLHLDDPHDEAKLVERLKSYMARKRKRCIVVFDSGLPGGLSRDLSTASVQAVFAHGGTNADAIIRERIHNLRDPGNWIVVSADHEITAAAARRHVRILSPVEFAAGMSGPALPDDGEDPDPHLSPDEVDDWLRLFGEDASTNEE